MSRHYDRLAVFWEMPLALGSYLFYKSVKAVMRGLLRIHESRNRTKDCKWEIITSEFLSKPGILPLVMTSGPRWNTHAVIGMLAPVVVRQSMEIDVGTANRAAPLWTIVVCTHPGREVVAIVGSLSSPAGNEKVLVPLPTGTYWLGLRYYHWSRDAELPAIAADGVGVAKSAAVPADANEFYRDLTKQQSNIFYKALHYYVFILLRYRKWFHGPFVEKEFLPVGNPETEFYFDALRKGEKLQLRIAPEALDGWDVFLTLYDRGSFPTHSEQVTQRQYEITARDSDRMCLIRVNRRAPGQSKYRREWVEAVVADAA